MSRNKVIEEHIQTGYILSLAYYKDKSIGLTDSVDKLEAIGMNRNSAKDLIYYITEFMKPNNTPIRTMSELAQTIYVKNLYRDLGIEAVKQWEENSYRHFEYMLTKNNKKISQRKNLAKLIEEVNK